jgi:hypothetical protein
MYGADFLESRVPELFSAELLGKDCRSQGSWWLPDLPASCVDTHVKRRNSWAGDTSAGG